MLLLILVDSEFWLIYMSFAFFSVIAHVDNNHHVAGKDMCVGVFGCRFWGGMFAENSPPQADLLLAGLLSSRQQLVCQKNELCTGLHSTPCYEGGGACPGALKAFLKDIEMRKGSSYREIAAYICVCMLMDLTLQTLHLCSNSVG